MIRRSFVEFHLLCPPYIEGFLPLGKPLCKDAFEDKETSLFSRFFRTRIRCEKSCDFIHHYAHARGIRFFGCMFGEKDIRAAEINGGAFRWEFSGECRDLRLHNAFGNGECRDGILERLMRTREDVFPDGRGDTQRFRLWGERRTVSIAHPHAGNKGRSVSERPEIIGFTISTCTLVIALEAFITCAGFCSGEIPRNRKHALPVLIRTRGDVTQDRGNLVRHTGIEYRLRVFLLPFVQNVAVAVGDLADRMKRFQISAIGKDTVPLDHFQKRSFRCPKREWPAILEGFSSICGKFLTSALGRRHTHLLDFGEDRIFAASEEECFCRGHVSRSRQCPANREKSPELPIEVLRFIITKFRGYISKNGRRAVTVAERCCVHERLEARSRLPGRLNHVDLPTFHIGAVFGIADVPENISRLWVSHERRDVFAFEALLHVATMEGDDFFCGFLDFPVERGFHI